jgi:hypothetical protein
MAFTDSLAISTAGINTNGSSNSNCSTEGGKMLTDNSTVGLITQVTDANGVVNANKCYAPALIEFTRFTDITIPAGATITGVRFTVDARAHLADLSDGLQYQVSINSGTNYTSLAALDLTGANNLKGATSEFHTTSGTTELHGLTFPTGDSDYDGTAVRWRITLDSGETNGKVVEIEFVKLRVYYDEASTSRDTYNNSSDEQVFSNGIVNVTAGLLKF